MSFRLKNTKHFSKELKRLIKKYPSLKSEFFAVASIIKENPFYGKPLGNGFYKID